MEVRLEDMRFDAQATIENGMTTVKQAKKASSPPLRGGWETSHGSTA